MLISVIEKPRRSGNSPEPGPQEVTLMAKSIMDYDRVLRQVLREAVDRFNHELLSDEERQHLLDRIKRLRRQLGLV
jgi:hypothetical protein